MNKYLKIALASTGFMFASMPTWAVYNVTTVTTGVADAVTAVLAIGAAVVLVVLGVKVFKWIARAL